MSDPLRLIAAWAAGAALGVVFFGGLWWTVQRAVTAPRPGMLFIGSLLLRMGVVAGGSYLVAGGRWERLLVCGVGIVMARPLVTFWTRPAREDDRAPHA